MNVLSGLWKKLLDKRYRQSYMESYASMLVPFQIRALREARGWTLEDLAERSGVSKKHLAYLEEAGAEPRTLKTLYKIAAAFDVAVSVEFVSFSTLVAREETFDPNRFHVAKFDEDTLSRTPEKKRDRPHSDLPEVMHG